MAFLSLRTASFRNLADAGINTSAKDVFLVGENGQGKTNFLEALYFCSYASSFRGIKDSDLARSGEESFSALAELDIPGQITVKVEKSKKTILLDGKKIPDRKDLLETIPTVAFCHEDMEFVSGSQERRRWFFDQTQSLYDPVYLDDLRKYRHVLKTRNAVLKEAKTGSFAGSDYRKPAELLDALEPQLAEYGVRLMEKRITAAERFSAVFSPLYEEVSGIAGIRVSYDPSWKLAHDKMAVINRLVERRAADLAQGITLSGPHRDRYLFLRDPAGEFSGNASTGQRRLLALLLRTAQARCFSGQTGKTPILLLDDVLLELDGEKRRRFLSVLPGYEQAFFTFLPEEPYKSYINSTTMIYYVRNGVIGNTGF
ncbi:MAG: DNA replication and repair protein RecF [Treponema sp.]|nr:DNA replication and repair protein RecF [Treponema sp.]